MENLTYLCLSTNEIENDLEDTFYNLPNLKMLLFNYDPIKVLHESLLINCLRMTEI